MTEIKCPRCGSTMSPGMRVDSTYGNIMAETWVPVRYFDDKSAVYDFMGMNIRKVGKQLITYACDGCGYLESYLKDVVEALEKQEN